MLTYVIIGPFCSGVGTTNGGTSRASMQRQSFNLDTISIEDRCLHVLCAERSNGTLSTIRPPRRSSRDHASSPTHRNLAAPSSHPPECNPDPPLCLPGSIVHLDSSSQSSLVAIHESREAYSASPKMASFIVLHFPPADGSWSREWE